MISRYSIEAAIVPGWRLLTPNPLKVTKVKHIVGATGSFDPRKKNFAQAHLFGPVTDVVEYSAGEGVPNPKKWDVPPHVAFANLCGDFDNTKPLTAVEVGAFLKKYGVLLAAPSGSTDAPHEIAVAEVRVMQQRVRDAWRRKDARMLWFPEGRENENQLWLPVVWSERGALAMRPVDVWTYLRVLLSCDIATGHAKSCGNERCPKTPYFISARTDAKYCSTYCGGGLRVAKFRKSPKRGGKKG
jgi:hypothetical protein